MCLPGDMLIFPVDVQWKRDGYFCFGGSFHWACNGGCCYCESFDPSVCKKERVRGRKNRLKLDNEDSTEWGV